MAKIKTALQHILNCFESGEIPEAIAYSSFPIPDLPSSNWSLLNRTLMFLSGTSDARGFKQWKTINRHVKKGAKAIYILVPRFIKADSEEDMILKGFMAKPVFKAEDTEGEPLSYQNIPVPEVPLVELAKQWGITVKAIPGNYKYYGYFSAGRKEIALATREESVFFHELSHAAHNILHSELTHLPLWQVEIVAELSAAALCKIVGKTSKYLGNQYRYISHYARKENLTPVNACLKVIREVEQVLGMILNPVGE